MSASDAAVFPIAGSAIRVGLAFYNTSQQLVTTWTGATCNVYSDWVSAGAQLTPVEAPANSGLGYVDIPAGYTTGGHCMGLTANLTNTNTVEVSGFTYLTNADPTTTPGSKPTDFMGRLFWIFCWFYGQNNANNGGGIAQVYIPNGNQPNPAVLTTLNVDANDLYIGKSESSP